MRQSPIHFAVLTLVVMSVTNFMNIRCVRLGNLSDELESLLDALVADDLARVEASRVSVTIEAEDVE
jgi:hypothetical protein